MLLSDQVRRSCADIARDARWVGIDPEALEALDVRAADLERAGAQLDPERHYLDGEPEHVAMYLLVLDAVNFGSGWFPQLHKRPGCSGYFTVAWSLSDRFRLEGPWSAGELRAMTTPRIADVLGQPPDLELMALYAQALRSLGGFLGDAGALAMVAEARGSAQALAARLAASMPMFNDVGFYKRAQIVAHDLQLAGLAAFSDLDRLTIFADNLVPHVLRCEGVLVYDGRLAAHIDAGRTLPMGESEREIRACAVHAGELLSGRTGIPPRELDHWLWNRGQLPQYKARRRHRCKTVFY
jgi:hypothetical protein